MRKNKQQGLLLFSILVVSFTFVISSPKVFAATIKNEKDLLLSLPSLNQNQPSKNSPLSLPKPKVHYQASRSISVSSNNVTSISTCQQLQNINSDESSLAGNYILTGNIDCTNATREGGALWNDGAGFEPIGRAATPFTGTLNGNGKTITGLYINRPTHVYVGLFGKSAGQIDNLNVYDVDINGGENSGAVVGSNRGIISNTHSSGFINYELAERESEPMGGNYWDIVMNGDNPVHVYFYHWTAPTTQDITLVEPGNYDYFPAIVFLASDTPGLDGNWSGTPVAEGTFSNQMPTFHAEQGVEYTIALTGGNNSSCGRTIDLAPFLTSLGVEFTEPAEHTFDSDPDCSNTPDSTESDSSVYDQIFSSIGGLVGFNDGTIRRTSSSATVNAPMAMSPGQRNQTFLGVGGLVGTNFNYFRGEGITESTASGDVSRSDDVGPAIDPRMPTFHAEQGVEYTIALTGGNNSSCGRTIDLAPFLTSLGVEFTEPAEHTFDEDSNCSATADSTSGGDNYWNTVMHGDNPVHVYFYHWTAPTTEDITLVAPGNYDYFPAIVFLASDTPGLDGNWSGTPVAEGTFNNNNSDNTGAFGGLVGMNYGGNIDNGYSKGIVKGGMVTGGLVAYNFMSNIQKSYSTGPVSRGTFINGGLAGIGQNDTITDSFWDKQTSGLNASYGGTGKTTAEMKDVNTYTQLPTAGLTEPWDFVNNPNNDSADNDIWSINPDTNSGYPCLSWQGDGCSLDGSSAGDQDNISDIVENSAPNSGDANNDGTPDSEQSNVASFVDPVTGDYAVLEVSDECTVNSVSIDEESTPHPDSDFSYPNGLMDFTLDCGTPGFTADVTQYYYGASGDFVVRKYNPSTKTYTTIDQAELSNQTIDSQKVTKATYQVKDGGSLDLDGTEDGNIHDPTGLATTTDTLANTGQNTHNIELLAIALLTSGLAIATYSFNRRRKGNHATTKN